MREAHYTCPETRETSPRSEHPAREPVFSLVTNYPADYGFTPGPAFVTSNYTARALYAAYYWRITAAPGSIDFYRPN